MAEHPGEKLAACSWNATMALSKLSRTLKQDDLGADLPRMTALSVVCERGPISVSELSTTEGVSCATMSRTVAALERAGLVRCQSDGEDRRAVLVQTTAKGRTALKRVAQQSKRRIRELVNSLDAKSLRALHDLVTTIYELDRKKR